MKKRVKATKVGGSRRRRDVPSGCCSCCCCGGLIRAVAVWFTLLFLVAYLGSVAYFFSPERIDNVEITDVQQPPPPPQAPPRLRANKVDGEGDGEHSNTNVVVNVGDDLKKTNTAVTTTKPSPPPPNLSVRKDELVAQPQTDYSALRVMGPRFNLPPKLDQNYVFQKNDPWLLPPQLDGKCGSKAALAPAWVPRWTDADQSPEWCLGYPASPRGKQTPVFLSAHLYIRVYAADRSALTKLDLAHWLTYYRYAGFERVYIYDCYLYKWEKVDEYPPIAQAIESGFVVYVDWHEGAKANYNYAKDEQRGSHMNNVQYPASEDVMKQYGEETRWMSFMDMDE